MVNQSSIARIIGAGALVFGLASVATRSTAAVPGGVTQQGRLLDVDGNPVDGTIQFLFRIYDQPSGGNALWTETQDLTLDEGFFSARLGDDGDNLFPDDLFGGEILYVGIKIGTDDEMVPRERISSVPYAFVAERAEEADHALIADMATNVEGDITPRSIAVDGVQIVDSNGNLHGFSRVVQQVTGDESADGSAISATASCPAAHVVVGGGCSFTSYAEVKVDAPDFSEQEWVCAAVAAEGLDEGTTEISATPYAICLPD